MGCFSWLKADKLTKVANIVEDEPFKFLIPKEFGGGFIKDNYQGYGEIGKKEDGSPKYDVYELLALWNSNDGEMKEIDEETDYNRRNGIDIGCYKKDIDLLKYPLKFVSCSYNGTYEDCEGRSYGDPNQGWGKLYRSKLKEEEIY
jgi:hypothetical protein